MEEKSNVNNTTRPPLELLDLPLELVEMIFDDAWRTSVPEAPPCKLLDTAWARRRWRSIEIITLNDLKDLLSLLETAPHRALFIRILVLAEYALEYEGLDEETEEKRDALLAGPLRALFSLVGPSLTDLDASEADKVSTCVHLYGLLDLLPKLEALEISDLPPYQDDDELDNPFAPLPSLEDLNITRHTRSPGIGRLVCRLHNLKTLRFYQPSSCFYDDVLECLRNPALLEELVFEDGCNDLPLCLVDFLPSCTNLTTLHITDSPFNNLTPDFRLVLQNSSISTLTLGGTSMAADELLSLVSGPTRMMSLRTLHLNGPWGREEHGESDRWQPIYGWKADECELDLDAFMQSWWLPVWGEGMEGRAEEVVEVATRNGIKVNGMILRGIAAEKEYREELAKLEEMIRNTAAVTTA